MKTLFTICLLCARHWLSFLRAASLSGLQAIRTRLRFLSWIFYFSKLPSLNIIYIWYALIFFFLGVFVKNSQFLVSEFSNLKRRWWLRERERVRMRACVRARTRVSVAELLSSCSWKSRDRTPGRNLIQAFSGSSDFWLYLSAIPLALTSAVSQVCPKAGSPHETKNLSGI